MTSRKTCKACNVLNSTVTVTVTAGPVWPSRWPQFPIFTTKSHGRLSCYTLLISTQLSMTKFSVCLLLLPSSSYHRTLTIRTWHLVDYCNSVHQASTSARHRTFTAGHDHTGRMIFHDRCMWGTHTAPAHRTKSVTTGIIPNNGVRR